MNHLKDITTGIDVNIQKLQVDLYEYLVAKWSIAESKIACYGRCMGIPNGGYGNIPAVWKTGIDYQPVGVDDTLYVQSFFGMSGRPKINGYTSMTTNVHLIIMLNLKAISAATGRTDEERRIDVYRLLAMNLYGFTCQEQITGIDEVFREYPGIYRDQAKYQDMQPWHYVRYDMQLTFNPRDTVHTPVSTILGKTN